MKPLSRFCAAAVATFLMAGQASAITVVGQNFGTDVSAEVNLVWDGTDTLTITIENTADVVAVTAAFVTGFAFNVPTGALFASFTASGTLDDAAWHELFPPPANAPGNAPGGYDFEGGAGTGINIAGGTPGDGFGIGTTATFTFTFTGALAGLTAGDFLGEAVAGDAGPADFGVRFQGIPTGAGSDFAVNLVPAPGAAVLLALSLPMLLRRRLVWRPAPRPPTG